MNAQVGSTWRLLKPHVVPRLPMLVGVFLLGLAVSAQGAALLLIGPLWELVLFPGQNLDSAVASHIPEGATKSVLAVFGWFSSADPASVEGRNQLLWMFSAALVGIGVFTGVAEYLFTWFSRLLSYRVVVDLRLRIARHLMALPLSYHGRRQFGDLLSRISSDVNTTLFALNIGLKELVQEPIQALVYLSIAAWHAPLLALVMLVTLPLLAIPLSLLARRVRQRSTKSLDSLGQSVQALTQMFQGIRTVKAFRSEEREVEGYRELNEGYLKASMKMVRAIAMTHAWTTSFSLLGLALMVVLIGWLNLRFGLFDNGGDMAAFILAVAQASNHIKSLTKAWTRVQESVGASTRLSALLNEPNDLVEAANPVRLGSLGRGIAFEQLGFSYPGSEEPALCDFTLQIRPGETLAIVGPSGSGKSTTLDLICRFLDPSSGQLLVDGHPLAQIALDDWSALYARVDQTPFLFHASVAENIRYGRPDATQEELEQAARSAGIHDFLLGLPEGYATNVADMGTRLSGGQRQRITIARAFLKNAPLLLLDEATSSLDSESERVVQAALERLMADKTVVVIAHRLSTVRRAQRIAVLEHGRLVALGTHDELLSSSPLYARMVALQQFDGPLAEPSPAQTR